MWIIVQVNTFTNVINSFLLASWHAMNSPEWCLCLQPFHPPFPFVGHSRLTIVENYLQVQKSFIILLPRPYWIRGQPLDWHSRLCILSQAYFSSFIFYFSLSLTVLRTTLMNKLHEHSGTFIMSFLFSPYFFYLESLCYVITYRVCLPHTALCGVEKTQRQFKIKISVFHRLAIK